MSKINKLFFSFVFILIFSCSLNNRIQNKENLLRKEIQRWQNFQIDGIAEINYKAYRFRKDIRILKSEKSVRIVLFNTGIFGLSPSPFLNFYADSERVELKFMGKKTDYTRLSKQKEFLPFLKMKLSKKNIREIVDSGKLQIENSTIFFSREMRINRIKLDAYKVEVYFDYSSGKLISIRLTKDNKNIGNIRIDRISVKKNITIENIVS